MDTSAVVSAGDYQCKAFEESARLHAEALEIRRRLYGDTHADTAMSAVNLGEFVVN